MLLKGILKVECLTSGNYNTIGYIRLQFSDHAYLPTSVLSNISGFTSLQLAFISYFLGIWIQSILKQMKV